MVPTKKNLNIEKSFSKLFYKNFQHRISYNDGVKSLSTKYETTDERIIERDVAKPLIMLSAYLITAAIIKPPTAYRYKRTKNYIYNLYLYYFILPVV